jgi:hypothetical protein
MNTDSKLIKHRLARQTRKERQSPSIHFLELEHMCIDTTERKIIFFRSARLQPEDSGSQEVKHTSGNLQLRQTPLIRFQHSSSCASLRGVLCNESEPKADEDLLIPKGL